MKTTSTILDSLGPARSTREQKRAYLTRIAQGFHATAQGVLRGQYGLIKDDNLKLRKAVRDANDRFMQELTMFGHRVPFMDMPVLQHLQRTPPKNVQDAFQPTTSGLFAKPTTSTQTPGGSGGTFGNTKPVNVGSETPWATVDIPFRASSDEVRQYQNISYMPGFKSFSFEELRLRDYCVQGQAKSGSSGFFFEAPSTASATPDPKQSTSAFGSTPNNAPASGLASHLKATDWSFGSPSGGSNAAPTTNTTTNPLFPGTSQGQPPKGAANLFPSLGHRVSATSTPLGTSFRP